MTVATPAALAGVPGGPDSRPGHRGGDSDRVYAAAGGHHGQGGDALSWSDKTEVTRDLCLATGDALGGGDALS